MKLLYAAASIAAALLAAAIATSGVPLSEPLYYMPVATLTLVAIGMLYLTFRRKESTMSDGPHTPDAAEAIDEPSAPPARPQPVSHSPLRHMIEREDYFQEFLGILLLIGTMAVLIVVLIGQLDFDGSINIHGIWIPWIIAVVLVAQWIYQQQERISFIRPTGPKAGFWFGFIDIFLSTLIVVIAAVMFGGVVVRWMPAAVTVFWNAYLPLIPMAKYNTTSLVMGFFFVLYGWRDVRKQYARARYGRDELVQQRAASVAPTNRQVIMIPKEKVPHGFAVFRRKSNLDIDYDNGPLSVG